MKLINIKNGEKPQQSGKYYCQWKHDLQKEAFYDITTDTWYDSSYKNAAYTVTPELACTELPSLSSFLLLNRKLEMQQKKIDEEYASTKEAAKIKAELEVFTTKVALTTEPPTFEAFLIYEEVNKLYLRSVFDSELQAKYGFPERPEDRSFKETQKWAYQCFLKLWEYVKNGYDSKE